MGRCKHPLSRQENEKLIELVRQHRALYDPSYQDHKDPNFLHAIWAEIAEDMGKEQMDGLEWKKKWRNLRDTYVKKIRGIRQNVNVTCNRSWRFFEHMSFLEPFLEDNFLHDESSVHTQLTDDSNSEAASNRDEDTASNSADGLRPPSPLDVKPRISSQSRKRARPEVSDPCDAQWKFGVVGGGGAAAGGITSGTVVGRGVEALDRCYLSEPPTLSDCYGVPAVALRGASQSFFDSCAVRMERLPARTQSYLQFQIAQLFFNAENPEATPVPILPLPEHGRAPVGERPA